jgi:hypothetical protein
MILNISTCNVYDGLSNSKDKLRQEVVSLKRLGSIYALVGLDIGSETPEKLLLVIL